MEMHAVDNGDGSELDLVDVADGDEADEELEDSRQDHGQRLRGRRHHLLFRRKIVLTIFSILSNGSYFVPVKLQGKDKTQSIWFVILKAQIETRTPYMLCKDRALPFQWCQDIPGECIRLVHSYSRVLLLSNSKCKRYFCNHLKPAKLIWTAMCRKQQKNVYGDLIRKCKYNDLDIRVEAAKKRHRTTKSPCGLAVNRLWTRH
ncbi:60S ribosomal protein L24 [Triticum urartu]|uniref:60S ribosomal protein L24 n=1 Tax=Triticum urartu TaxID=4572 RepID=M8A2L2_TRIUA|nr:60S ribosomal protein L24 [Triticum urartu]